MAVFTLGLFNAYVKVPRSQAFRIPIPYDDVPVMFWILSAQSATPCKKPRMHNVPGGKIKWNRCLAEPEWIALITTEVVFLTKSATEVATTKTYKGVWQWQM